MVKRVITSVIALPIFFFFICYGGNVLNVGVLLLSIIGLYEYSRAFNNIDIRPMFKLSILATIGIYLVYMFNLDLNFYLLILTSYLIMLMLINLFNESDQIIDISVTALGFIYVVLCFMHLPLLASLGNTYILLIAFILAWITDTCAYFAGRFFGKRKLLPSVSPKKTVEGAIGGTLGTLIFTVVYTKFFVPDFPMFLTVPLAVIGSISGQIGDLIASKIKRYTGIKDFGKIFPGHGGVLDRFDSILLTAPVVYYFAVLYLNILK